MFTGERVSPEYAVNAIRNMVTATSDTMAVTLLALLHDRCLCGCRRCRNDDCTESWKMNWVGGKCYS